MSEDQRTSLRRAIEILESARSRKAMYFSPVKPNVVTHWLHGVRTGLLASGIEWSPDDRQAVVEARGLRFEARWEAEQLAGRSPEEIVDELLLIEIEMWRRMADSPT